MFFQIQFALVLQVLVLLTRASSVKQNKCAETTTPLQGTFVGNCLEEVEEYLGIPYATPPVDALRFSKTTPLPKYSSSKKRPANEPGSACRQPPFFLNDVQKSYAEDCLYLNIYAPKKSKKSLPVLFWIHGGAFLNGAGSGEQFNATKLLTQSLKLREPIIFVSINYRLGAFGFLGGSTIANAAKEGKAALNAGYYDQREALHWVQRNIASFGGDPKKVTIFGESAGANSVGQQMLAKEGDVQGLFRAAIMQSGNPSVSRRLPPTHPFAQDGYNAFLTGAGCSLETSEPDQLRCLRNASSDALNDANSKAASGKQAAFVPLQDDFFVRGLPSAQFKRGAFPDIPYIQGDNLDEGTVFALSTPNVTSDEDFSKTVTSTYGDELEPLLPQILKLWSSSPAKGSPYEPQLFGKSQSDLSRPPSSVPVCSRSILDHSRSATSTTLSQLRRLSSGFCSSSLCQRLPMCRRPPSRIKRISPSMTLYIWMTKDGPNAPSRHRQRPALLGENRQSPLAFITRRGTWRFPCLCPSFWTLASSYALCLLLFPSDGPWASPS
ncbi:alpha/beta-hydrolase [Acaromyces ingoldii]|uniref:Carboxylic ester hydrolase n=1 Tax=Acaromyces ingoldii TaxID=215250 RepID=A0A316YBS3_9BASI|nr:alpha/beta-hydrolase [Acaromyces ingoldii]PWN86742.1 alpha/beta-hydrolase [Acaromyces ingoldii]